MLKMAKLGKFECVLNFAVMISCFLTRPEIDENLTKVLKMYCKILIILHLQKLPPPAQTPIDDFKGTYHYPSTFIWNTAIFPQTIDFTDHFIGL